MPRLGRKVQLIEARRCQWARLAGLLGCGTWLVCLISWQYTSSRNGLKSWQVCRIPWMIGTGSETASISCSELKIFTASSCKLVYPFSFCTRTGREREEEHLTLFTLLYYLHFTCTTCALNYIWALPKMLSPNWKKSYSSIQHYRSTCHWKWRMLGETSIPIAMQLNISTKPDKTNQ